MIIYAVIVLYNKSYKEAVTLNCLKNEKDIKIIVCDNSTKDYGNSVLEKEIDNAVYINMGGNMGLSKAYNKAVEQVDTNGDGFVCLFDDDTQLPENYFTEMRKYMQGDSDIILPVVYDNYGYMSPSVIKKAKVVRLFNLDEMNIAEVTGINSGMAIRASVFSDFRYDEGYFLDYIDHAFIREMKKRNKIIEVARSIELHQDFSGNDYFHFQSTKNRFKIFYKDFWHFCAAEGKTETKIYAAFALTYRWIYMYVVIKNYPFYAKHFRTPYHKYIKKDGKFYD